VVRAHPTVPPLRISPLSQQLTDRPDVFAPPKIQKALQMALRMVELVRAKGGGFIARKGIPADVRDDYERLYGVRWEAQLRIPSGTPIPFAKSQHGEWLAEIETRIAALRAQRNGEGQPLTRLNAIALAGRWYVWFVKQHEANPGPAKCGRSSTPRRPTATTKALIWTALQPGCNFPKVDVRRNGGRWQTRP